MTVGLTPPGYHLPPLSLEAAGLRDPMTLEHGDRGEGVKRLLLATDKNTFSFSFMVKYACIGLFVERDKGNMERCDYKVCTCA